MAPHDTAEILRQLAAVNKRLDAQDKKYDDRREEDDAREARAQRERQELIERVERHGKRTTVLETNWTAFFGEQGAFRGFCNRIDKHDDKIDELKKYVLIGVGLILAAEFLIPLVLPGLGRR